MKIQTTAHIEQLSIDGKPHPVDDKHPIALEFSTIDTGGGFKDPILDFSFSIENSDADNFDNAKHTVSLALSDPGNEDNNVTFEYEGTFQVKEKGMLEANGRLKEDKLSRELIGFVLKRLR